MRKLWLVILLVILFIPTVAYAQTPEPPPSGFSCLPGNFDGAKCGEALGIWGYILFAILAVLAFVFTPIGKKIQEQIGNIFEEWRNRRPASLLTEDQKQENRVLYQNRLASELDESAIKTSWMNALGKDDVMLRPSEDKNFISLSGDLAMELRIGFSRQIAEKKPYEVIKTFTSIEDAVNFADETGKPYPVLALIGEPGAGKSTLLRKFARQAVKDAQADITKPWVLFVSLSSYTGGNPLHFLSDYWKNQLDYDGLQDNLIKGNVWLFLDGLNEVPRKVQDTAKAEWKSFLNGRYFQNSGNRAIITSREADYGDGVGVPRLNVYKMNEEQIQIFLKKYALDRADDLWVEIKKDRDKGNGAIYYLAQTPFWLEKIAFVSAHRAVGKALPENRAQLVADLVEQWLLLEEERRNVISPLPAEQRERFLNGLSTLAWQGLSFIGPNTPIPFEKARTFLKKALLPVEEVFLIAKTCNLILEDKGKKEVTFFHQLLQEYFAAREFARQFAKGKKLSKKWKTDWRRWKFVKSKWDPMPPPPTTGWEETIILAAGMLNGAQAEKLILQILEHNSPLAARCILESGAYAPCHRQSPCQIGRPALCKTTHRAKTNFIHRPRMARRARGKILDGQQQMEYIYKCNTGQFVGLIFNKK
jgi:hypothetical protein